MSIVYEAAHVVLPRRAAIKVMHGELCRQHGMTTRMMQEAAILEEIRHPGLLRVHECDVLEDGRPWIAMELARGESLTMRLRHETVLSPAEVGVLLAAVADVLAAVHSRGVVHRDLKPDNLLVTPADPDFPLRVIDWGVARIAANGRLTLDGMTPGTPIYMSPEQATGRNITAACDIYSLGVTAYEALAGHPPFDGRTLAEVVCMHMTTDADPLPERCEAPAALCGLIHRMLAKDPAKRPSAREVRQRARALALEAATSRSSESFEISSAEPVPARARPAAGSLHVAAPVLAPAAASRPTPASRARRELARPSLHVPTSNVPFVPSDEIAVVDPRELELGVTESVPVPRRPRWTPEIGTILKPAVARAITPRAERDQVAGEIELLDRRRRA